jgi:hypothetical protein
MTIADNIDTSAIKQKDCVQSETQPRGKDNNDRDNFSLGDDAS